jgi:hypothetical protein
MPHDADETHPLPRFVLTGHRVGGWSVLRPGVGAFDPNGAIMSKRARKRRTRKGNGANHGRRPNA